MSRAGYSYSKLIITLFFTPAPPSYEEATSPQNSPTLSAGYLQYERLPQLPESSNSVRLEATAPSIVTLGEDSSPRIPVDISPAESSPVDITPAPPSYEWATSPQNSPTLSAGYLQYERLPQLPESSNSVGLEATAPSIVTLGEDSSPRIPVDISRLDISPEDISPANNSPTDISHVDISPVDISPADSCPADSSPADSSPVDSNSVEVHFKHPIQACLIDRQGNHASTYIYVISDHIVYVLDASGKTVCSWATSGKEPRCGMCFDLKRDLLLVASGQFIIRTTRQGEKPRLGHNKVVYVSKAKAIGSVAHHLEKDRYVITDLERNAVLIVDPESGKVMSKVKSTSGHPVFVTCCKMATVDLLATTDQDSIELLNRKGEAKGTLGSHGREGEQLRKPGGTCVDGKGRLVVCDCQNKRVVRYTPCTGNRGDPSNHGNGQDWGWECVLSPDHTCGRCPAHVDISTTGDMIVSLMTSDGNDASILIIRNYE